MWDAVVGNLLYRLPGHGGTVNDVDFHPKEPIREYNPIAHIYTCYWNLFCCFLSDVVFVRQDYISRRAAVSWPSVAMVTVAVGIVVAARQRSLFSHFLYIIYDCMPIDNPITDSILTLFYILPIFN